jgi:class 3 adenylate cyclase
MAETSHTSSRFPTGTVTFLFTDIEGSTTLWEQDPVTMQAALTRDDHTVASGDRVTRWCIAKTTGDGVVAVFGAADALAAGLATLRSLQAPEAGVALDTRSHMPR